MSNKDIKTQVEEILGLTKTTHDQLIPKNFEDFQSDWTSTVAQIHSLVVEELEGLSGEIGFLAVAGDYKDSRAIAAAQSIIDSRIKELKGEQKDASGSPGMPAKDVKMHHTPNTSQNKYGGRGCTEGGGGGNGGGDE